MTIEDVAFGVGIAATFCGVLRYVIKADTTAIVNGKLVKLDERIDLHEARLGRIDDHVGYLDSRVVTLEQRKP